MYVNHPRFSCDYRLWGRWSDTYNLSLLSPPIPPPRKPPNNSSPHKDKDLNGPMRAWVPLIRPTGLFACT